MTTNDSKSLSQERYTKYADGYVTSKTHAKGSELERLVEIAQPQPDWSVLDVATGGGHTALKFATHVAHVTATDITPRMLEKARAHLAEKGATNVDFKVADAEDLPFDNESFDLVTCRIAPHHFPSPRRFVRECARVLKPGGLLLVQDQVVPDDEGAAHYINAFERLRDPSHNQARTEREWLAMFREAGLTVEHMEQIAKRHEFAIWVEMQGCTPETIAHLTDMLRDAPPLAAGWLEADGVGTPEAFFANVHIIVAGRKV